MSCEVPTPLFPHISHVGLKKANPQRDGYTITLEWDYATSPNSTYNVGYNIYYSTERSDVFVEGVKHFTTETTTDISGFNPGGLWYFVVRATLYDPLVFNLTMLPTSTVASNAYDYPYTELDAYVDPAQLNIPLVDGYSFPTFGVIKVGAELISYSSITGSVVNGTYRGFYSTYARSHELDGYDGISYKTTAVIPFYGFEDRNSWVVEAEPRFEYPNFPYTQNDGYKTTATDILTTDLSASDAENVTIPGFEFSGYTQANPLDIFSGNCVGSYASTSRGCADDAYGPQRSGVNVQEYLNKMQEILLSVKGEPIVLISRLWTGIRCQCFRSNNEQPEARCSVCYNVGYVGGYQQYNNPRRKDGRIMVSFAATADSLTLKNIGMQENFVPNCWTQSVPTVKHRDILIRFNLDGTEEFRYEVVNVSRGKTFFSQSGSQQMQIFRLDKSDIAYQWRAVRDTTEPVVLNTSISTLASYGPHYHTIVIPNTLISNNQINGTTAVMASHSHPIINGVVLEVLGHTHTITL